MLQIVDARLTVTALTGTLFWKWGFCPENDQTDSLQVSSGDVDFKNVIVPASMSAISQALSASPIANCSVVSTLVFRVNNCPKLLLKWMCLFSSCPTVDCRGASPPILALHFLKLQL